MLSTFEKKAVNLLDKNHCVIVAVTIAHLVVIKIFPPVLLKKIAQFQFYNDLVYIDERFTSVSRKRYL